MKSGITVSATGTALAAPNRANLTIETSAPAGSTSTQVNLVIRFALAN